MVNVPSTWLSTLLSSSPSSSRRPTSLCSQNATLPAAPPAAFCWGVTARTTRQSPEHPRSRTWTADACRRSPAGFCQPSVAAPGFFASHAGDALTTTYCQWLFFHRLLITSLSRNPIRNSSSLPAVKGKQHEQPAFCYSHARKT